MYGDQLVVRREFLGLLPYGHHGVELPTGEIAENSPPGIRVVRFDDFARGSATRVVARNMSLADRDLAVERALSRVGERGYSLGGWNCEHFATWRATGVACSQQVAEVIAALLALLKATLMAGAVFLGAAALEAALAE